MGIPTVFVVGPVCPAEMSGAVSEWARGVELDRVVLQHFEVDCRPFVCLVDGLAMVFGDDHPLTLTVRAS